MARFIIVQTSAHALYGLFTVADGSDKAAVQVAACASCSEWTTVEDRPNTLDTSTLLSQAQDDLCVFEVPSDVAAYDETTIDAGSVNDGEIFENFRHFRFVGTLVRRVTLNATYGDETFVGISDSTDNDARLQIAADDLASELPSGEDGDEVDVKDESGDVVGTLTYEADYGRWGFAA